MARPSGVRTLAGYTLGDRLAQDLYGEVYRATEGMNAGKKEVTLLVVDPRLAADDQFSEALARGTAPLNAFHHRSVVGTIVVAQDGKSLVVVTEGTTGAITLAAVLERARARGGKVPGRIATAIARSIVDGVATAHGAGIVHGALHPRSVLLDREGNVRVTDFAVGNAAMSAAAAGSDAMSLKGLAGYLAPELALGDEPSPASDVYAVGSILFTMLTGETPPGSLNTSAAIERLVQRALDTDLARRFGNAVELQENLAEALEDDRWESASASELARFVGDQGASPDSNLDAATEDLLASLSGGAVEVTRPTSAGLAPIGGNASGVGSGVGSGMGDSGIEDMAQAHARRPGSRPGARRAELDSLLADLEDSTADGPLTVVDEPRGQTARDPISELIALEAAEDAATNIHDPEHTPLPPPQPDEPGTLTREAQSDGSRTGQRRVESAPQPSRLVEKTRPKHKPEATPPPVLEAPKPPPPAAPADPPRMKFVKPADDVDEVPVPTLKRNPLWTWLGLFIIIAGGAALFFYIKKQGKEMSAGEKAAAETRAKKEKERDELERRLRAEQADPGSIRVSSTPDGAAVWLLLGRTPFDSISLKTQAVWEMRVELDGHKTQDVRVGGAGWTGKPEDLRASIDVKLEPGSNEPALPAMPPEPPASDRAGLVDGSGSLHATSKPEGAAVWLLVGVTNTMELSGIEAGQAYELRVTKDGFVPGYVRITGEEWRQGGDPNLPLSAAPKREVIDKSVELVPAPSKKSP